MIKNFSFLTLLYFFFFFFGKILNEKEEDKSK